MPATDEDAKENALKGYAAARAAETTNATSKPAKSAKSPPTLLRANSIPILKTPKERIRRTQTPSDQVSEGSTVTPRQSDVVADATSTGSDGTPTSRHDSSHDSSHDSTRATGDVRKKGPGIKGKKLKKKGKTGKKTRVVAANRLAQCPTWARDLKPRLRSQHLQFLQPAMAL